MWILWCFLYFVAYFCRLCTVLNAHVCSFCMVADSNFTLSLLCFHSASLPEPATESWQLCHVAPERPGLEPVHQQEPDEERTETQCCSVSLHFISRYYSFACLEASNTSSVAECCTFPISVSSAPLYFDVPNTCVLFQIWHAGVWCRQDHNSGCGPQDEPHFPAAHRDCNPWFFVRGEERGEYLGFQCCFVWTDRNIRGPVCFWAQDTLRSVWKQGSSLKVTGG